MTDNDNNEKFYTARGYEISTSENNLTPSMEDYIEMIYRLNQKNGYTRVNDLANRLNVQPPSVTNMMKKLHDNSLLKYEKYGVIHLTEKGKKIGKFLLDRHNVLKDFLTMLGLKKHIQKEVEQIEHHISWDTFLTINAFVSFLKENDQIIEQFNEYKNNKIKE